MYRRQQLLLPTSLYDAGDGLSGLASPAARLLASAAFSEQVVPLARATAALSRTTVLALPSRSAELALSSRSAVAKVGS